MSVEIKVDTRELARVQARFDALAKQIRDPADLMSSIAGLLESQTKQRIQDEKAAPDGTAWKLWSREYARTRKGKHSLLIDTQALLDDIQSTVGGPEAVVFATMVYAGAQNAERPFLGLSRANGDEIISVLEDWVNGQLT